MKTFLPLKLVLATLFITCMQANAQTYSGLVFKNPTLISGTDLQLNAVYLFHDVKQGTDATVTISELVNGATVTKIDDNAAGLGYGDAFQPEVSSPSGLGQSYAVFSIAFFEAGTQITKKIDNVKATALDIDGGLLMKEFAEIDMNGGVMNYLTSTLDISVINILLKKFKGENIIGIEKTGIDTLALGNMFTVTQTEVEAFTVTAGTKRILGAWGGPRQFSFFMKGFNYTAPLVALPVDLLSFTAALDNGMAELKWETASEKNVSRFVIEKGYDGKSFNDAGIVFAYGNTNSKSSYSFPDQLKNVQVPAVYYRLRSIDMDGRSQYSEVRMIRLSKQVASQVSISSFPNPATTDLKITIPISWQGRKISYEIINNAGQGMLRKDAGQASQTESLEISRLPKGFYIVRVSCENETAMQKIIKN